MEKKIQQIPPETHIHRWIRRGFKGIYWIYLIGTLAYFICGLIGLYPSEPLLSIFQENRAVFFLILICMLVLTSIGALLKFLRKRAIVAVFIAGVLVFALGQVVDYVMRDPSGNKYVDVSGTNFIDVSGTNFSDTMGGDNTFIYASVHPVYDTYVIEADNSKYDHQKENPVKLVAEEPVSTFSIDVDTSSYANVRRYLDLDHLPPTDAVRVEEMINYFPYDYAGPKNQEAPFAIHTTLMPSPWKDGNKLLHIGIKGYEQTATEEKPLNLVLLIDTSGSMYGADRLDLIKAGFNMLVDKMTEKDTISIVTYAGSSEVLLPPTSGDKKRQIKSAISSLSANGGTWGEGGLKKAYELAKANFDKNGVNRILLGTDGDFNIGNTRNESLMDFVSRQSKSGIYLSILNVGRNNYNDALMQKLAQNGNGIGYYLDSIVEAKRILSDDIKKTLFPIADDVKIQVEFNPAQVSEYRLIGYETRLLNREDFNNDNVDAGEINAGHTVTAIYEITPVGSDNKLVDDLRYAPKPMNQVQNTDDETAFVRVRYKLPGESKSRLIEQPVIETVPFDQVPDDVRFSVAVAGFGQKLRASNFVNWTWQDVRRVAKKSLGEDTYGYRQGFLSLIDKAEALSLK